MLKVTFFFVVNSFYMSIVYFANASWCGILFLFGFMVSFL